MYQTFEEFLINEKKYNEHEVKFALLVIKEGGIMAKAIWHFGFDYKNEDCPINLGILLLEKCFGRKNVLKMCKTTIREKLAKMFKSIDLKVEEVLLKNKVEHYIKLSYTNENHIKI